MPKGKPLFNYEDSVEFDICLTQGASPTTLRGKVFVVDAYGTFEQDEHASYDIMVEDFGDNGCLFKHIPESEVRPVA